MKTYLKYILIFPILTVILIASCSEETPIVPPEAPIANVGPDQFVNVWDTVYLQGSLGKFADDVEYIWSLAEKPEGSNATLSDSSVSNPFFLVDKVGTYVVKLLIKQGNQYSDPDSVTITATFQKSNEYFPNSIGSKWIYKVRDSLRQIDVNVTVEIVGTTVLPDSIPATIWFFSCDLPSSACYDDTLFVRVVGDTVVTFLYNWQYNYIYGRASYIFPLVPGNGWSINYDSSLVVGKDSISICAGTFEEGFKIYRESQLVANYFLCGYTWLVSNVGLVRMNLVEYDFGPRREEHWELIWYHLAE